jgi:hypothetical protein
LKAIALEENDVPHHPHQLWSMKTEENEEVECEEEMIERGWRGHMAKSVVSTSEKG